MPPTASTWRMRSRGEIGIAQHPRLVGEAEELGQMDERAGALLAADHHEVILQAVEIGEEDDAGLVEAGRRLEDVARERHGRRQDVVEAAPRRPPPSRVSAAEAAGAMASKMPSSASE